MSDMIRRSWWQGLWRGFLGRCPACGRGRLFARFLKVADRCPACGEVLHHHRADDAPPYFTMLIVGHTIVPLMLVVEKVWHPSLELHLAIWIPATLVLTFLLMAPVKGAVVGLQWGLQMGGFGASSPADPALDL